MPAFFTMLGLIALLLLSTLVGPLATAVVLAVMASLATGLAASLIGLLVLTNVFHMNYEIAFRRSFVGGAAAVALLLSGFSAFRYCFGDSQAVAHGLSNLSMAISAGAFGVAVLTMLVWLFMVLRLKKSS